MSALHRMRYDRAARRYFWRRWNLTILVGVLVALKAVEVVRGWRR